MKKATVYRGLWYIPGNEKHHSGLLKISEKRRLITLTIYSNSYIDGTPVSTRGINDRIVNPAIILGEHMHPITLYDCRWSGTYPISDEINKITYKVGFVFEFAHFAKPEDIIIKSANIKFPYLASWYDGWKSAVSQDDELDKENLDVLNISPVFNIKFNNIEVRNKIPLHEYRKHVNFIYLQKVDFYNALHDWAEFASMLKLATSKNIGYAINWVSVDREFTIKSDKLSSDKTEVMCLVRNFSLGWHNNEDKKEEWIHQNDMVFSGWKLSKDIIDTIIIKWYKNKSMYPIYDYYIDSNLWPKDTEFRLSNVMFNNKFLNLIQGLEAYHFQLNESYSADNQLFVAKRQKVLNSIDRELKDWVNNNLKFPREYKLNERLHSLLNRFEASLKSILADLKYISYFPEAAKDLRHRLSHGNLDSTYQGEDLHYLLHIAQLLLCMCVLESLGLDNDRISITLDRNTQMNRIAYEAVYYYGLKNKGQKTSD